MLGDKWQIWRDVAYEIRKYDKLTEVFTARWASPAFPIRNSPRGSKTAELRAKSSYQNQTIKRKKKTRAACSRKQDQIRGTFREDTPEETNEKVETKKGENDSDERTQGNTLTS
ncbi:hypothetical protein N7488_008408 [Penicillium malachiteum]|nr:hypothetical protein N7488_008408 [Penicillium malachiteum]